MRAASLALICLILSACATSPTGRSQLLLFSDEEISQLGVVAFREIKTAMPETTNKRLQRYVRCVANNITRELAQTQGADVWSSPPIAKRRPTRRSGGRWSEEAGASAISDGHGRRWSKFSAISR